MLLSTTIICGTTKRKHNIGVISSVHLSYFTLAEIPCFSGNFTLNLLVYFHSFLRLELCHDKCDYYTELDYVCMYGCLKPCEILQSLAEVQGPEDAKHLGNREMVLQMSSDMRNLTLLETDQVCTNIKRDFY